jgi:hypothetical protein
MTLCPLSRVIDVASTGTASYVFCRAFGISQPFDKAVLVTVLVGLRVICAHTFTYLNDDQYEAKPMTQFLIHSTQLLAIPCALLIGRQLNFKVPDYLQLVGLTSIGASIASISIIFVNKLKKLS